MADAPVDSCQEQKEDGDKKKKNTLEEKSKEDLAILVRKYLSLLHKSKNKTDELNKKCLVLEQEKIEAQSKLEVLQRELELKPERVSSADKDQLIEDLKQKLREAAEENISYVSKLRENEEQLQCLNLQLKSLKDSCQCIQEENIKLKKLNEEKIKEISNVQDLSKKYMSNFNQKVQECNTLLNIKESYEVKLEANIEKIHSYQKEKEKLITENKNLQVENANLKERKLSVNQNEEDSTDIARLFDELQIVQEENKKLKKQLKGISKGNEIDSTDLGDETLKLKNYVTTLEQQKGTLEIEKTGLKSELAECHDKLHKLQEEIKNLITSSQLNDFKSGIEFALLQGATTESLIYPVEQQSSKTETLKSVPLSLYKETKETHTTENVYSIEEASGFEHALLGGGDISSLVARNDESSVYSFNIPGEKLLDTMNASNNDDLISEYKNVIKEKEVQIEKLQKNLDEYSALCRDTLDENTILRSKIEELTNKTEVIDQGNNTDFKYLEHSKSETEHKLEKYSTSVIETEDVSCEDHKKPSENCNYFHNKIIKFYQNIQSKRNFDSEKDISNIDPFELFKVVETLFDQLIFDLEEKKKELHYFNLQLELLVIAVKQGVRQKTSTMSYQVKNSLEENVSLLKQLLEELTTRTSCFESKKIIQSNTENEMQMILDELAQLKELSQFLEVENRELNTELKRLKSNLSSLENEKGEDFVEVQQQNSDLYSIDESTEFDDKTDDNLYTNVDKNHANTSDVSAEVFPSIKDSCIQIESNFTLESKKMAENKNSASQTDSVEQESQKDIEKLANENESLKKAINEKNNLVQNIHCEMDNFMTKVEDLTAELRIREDDLKHSQCLNADLKKMLAEAENNKNKEIAVGNSLGKESILTSDVSIQAVPSVEDSTAQIESHFSLDNKEVSENKNSDSQTEPTDDKYQKHINWLTSENESLQKVICEKSNLVEGINCEMDNLITKIEELTDELQIKNDDLKHSQCLNADLEKMLKEAENVKNQQIVALKAASNIMLDIKFKNVNLGEEVKSLGSNYKELISYINGDILNNIQKYCKNSDNLKEMCDHKDRNINSIKEWINEFIEEFEKWYNFMDQLTPELLDFDMSVLESCSQNSCENFHFQEICEDTCCFITEKISYLNSYKAKLFSAFYNHLNNYYRSLINDVHNYKVNIVPNMEKNLVELEKKISECTCRNSCKEEVKLVSENMQESAPDESMKNYLAETETKMNKFKQIALKLKKDLALTKEQYNDVVSEKEKLQKQNVKLIDEMNKITEDQCKYVQNYQTLQNEFDKLQDECEVQKQSMKKLEDDLTLKLVELTSSKEHILELENQLKSSKQSLDFNASTKKELDNKCADLESKVIVLESKISEKEQKINSMENDVSKYLRDIHATQEDNKNLKYQLGLAQKEGNKKSLLDLEMADFERSITELNNQIKKREDDIEELQKEIQSLRERNNCLQEELRSTESLKETEAKRAESLKEILEKTKLELNKLKEHDAELLSKNASLEVQFETMVQQDENTKLQLSQASAQIQHLQDVIKTSSENHQRIARSFEQKISNQKEEIHIAHKEVESVKQEFENYKIRVHSVLKQQKSVTPAVTTVDGDLTEKLETINERLKLQVKDLSEKLTALSLEYETQQDEYDALLQRYNKAIEDREQKDKEWQQRLELLNAEKTRLRAAQEELSSQHLLQNEMLVATYKKQIKIMSEEHKKIVNDLQKQLDAADVEIARLQRDQQKLQGLPVTPVPPDSSASFDLLSQERQEGEGSENTDEANTPIRHLSLATIPTSGFLSFEKLIQSPLEPGTPASYVSNYDSEKLSTDLSTANKKIDHLSEILNDSESTNMRLSEQVRVLKDEVRRLENNKEREQHAENLEYLKNIFIKFATLQPGSEKAMLIPVLTTMLKLSSNEQQQLKSIAGDLQAGDNINASWGSYLHRWSGLS